MSARVSRGVPSRGSTRISPRRKVVLNVDLNVPAIENLDEGTSSNPPSSEAMPVGQQGVAPQTMLIVQGVAPQSMLIDVDLIEDEDDVVLSSPRSFAEARNNSRRNRGGTIVDVDAEDSSRWFNNRNDRHRAPRNQQVINCESYVNLREQQAPPPPPPPPPPEPTFNCPVCMGPLVEEMSTKCGHIFCKACIRTALAAQNKCPTCRRKLTMKDTIRVYLPTIK